MNTLKKAILVLSLAIVPVCGLLAQGKERVTDTTREHGSIIDLLRKEPGVFVGQETVGGAIPTIYIRGIGTNTDQYQPLFVIDGVQTDNIMHLMASDVYSIEVIKDGTSSIYGMQGANGVIEITTVAAHETAKAQAEAAKAERLARKAARKNKNK